MKYKKSLYFLIVFLILKSVTYSQGELENVKKLNSKKKFKTSLKILNPYVENHTDINTMWLYAQTLHYAKKYNKSAEIYKQTINKFPSQEGLALDYYNSLAEAGKMEKAINKLKAFSSKSNENNYISYHTLAKIYYWKGEYDNALTYINKALQLYPNNKKSKNLKQQISLSRKNWLGLKIEYVNDNQPQSIISPEIEGGYYINDFATVGLKFNTSFYNAENKKYIGVGFKAFNVLNFHKLKAKTHIELGFDKLPNDSYAFNGLLLIKKNLYKHLNVELNSSFRPNLLTNKSLTKNIMELAYGLAFTWQNNNGFDARVAFDMSQFLSENNFYYTGSAWVLSPKLKLSVFDFRVGYGFSYSNSKTNTYTNINPLDSIIQTHWDNDQLQIEGFYDPIFTPKEQLINSAIASIDIRILKNLKMNIGGDFGFYSITKNPYLKLKVNDTNEYYIGRDFADEQYFPFKIKSSIDYNVLPNFLINASYQFQTTNYYNQHLAVLKAKFLF